jgi:serine/threonine-protein kinase
MTEGGQRDPGSSGATAAGPPGDAGAGAQEGLLASGSIVGKYRILELIGRGGMGVVYRAEHVDLGMLHALKTLAPELARHPQAQARFLKEARAAARINHPHVIRIFDCGTHDGLPFFVMEHLEGEDLGAILARTRLTVEQTAGIMLAVCAAISEMHRDGFIHRDLKPGNIFLARDKVGNIVPTVLDFGIVKPIEPGPSAARTQDGALVGTPHYISPEQVSDLPAGERSDQYALGVILYQCATGRVPFDGDTALTVMRQIASYRFPPPRSVRPDIHPDFEAVVLKAMSERAADRYPSVYHLGNALLPLAAPKHQAVWAEFYDRVRSPRVSLPMAIPLASSAAWLPLSDRTTQVAPEAMRPPPPRRRSSRRALLLGVAALAAGAAAVWMREHRSSQRASASEPEPALARSAEPAQAGPGAPPPAAPPARAAGAPAIAAPAPATPPPATPPVAPAAATPPAAGRAEAPAARAPRSRRGPARARAPERPAPGAAAAAAAGDAATAAADQSPTTSPAVEDPPDSDYPAMP